MCVQTRIQVYAYTRTSCFTHAARPPLLGNRSSAHLDLYSTGSLYLPYTTTITASAAATTVTNAIAASAAAAATITTTTALFALLLSPSIRLPRSTQGA